MQKTASSDSLTRLQHDTRRCAALLMVPIIIALFAYYMVLAAKPESSAQNP